MTTSAIRTLAITTALAGSSGCAIVGDIFKAGVWVGLVIVGLLVAVGFGLTRAFSSR